ncbi:MAG TPA: PilZ domain-containing protein [Treponemataceae bacterium]|nr:PilZ domain-containing protein [Treponemataceae bacterium]
MNIVPALLIVIAVILIFLRLIATHASRIKFYLIGLDFGFKILEINLLWNLAKKSDHEEPTALYWSINSLDECISTVITTARQTGTENTPKTQDFLKKLYKYRTKIELDPKNKTGMKTTKSLQKGQRLRIVLENHGVFSAKVLKIGRDLIISMPVKKNQIVIPGNEWVGKNISVYLYRHNDAGYVFDTYVKNTVQFNSKNALYLDHTENLLRTQKRRSVRAKTTMYGQLFLEKSETMNRLTPESTQGLRCFIEDVSENGALIRIGGKGITGLKLKLQYLIDEQVVVMYGIIKGVEYNKTINQSRIHFECLEIDPTIKNLVLTFVYNLLPQNEKDSYDAMLLASKDDEAVDDKNQKTAEETEETEEIEEIEAAVIETESNEIQANQIKNEMEEEPYVKNERTM